MEELKDSFVRGKLEFYYNGRKMPIRAGVVLKDLKLFPNRLYKIENEEAAKIICRQWDCLAIPVFSFRHVFLLMTGC